MNFQSGLFLRLEKLKVLSLFKLNKEKKKNYIQCSKYNFCSRYKKKSYWQKNKY